MMTAGVCILPARERSESMNLAKDMFSKRSSIATPDNDLANRMLTDRSDNLIDCYSQSTQITSDSATSSILTRSNIKSVSPSNSSRPNSPRNFNSNDKRKARREDMIQLMADDLIEIACDLFMAEQKVCSIVDVISAWNNTQASHEMVSPDAIKKAIENFINSLPPRYVLGINSPDEVMLHMRIIDETRKFLAKSVVHISSFDDIENWKESLQLAFCPATNGMGNLKVVTISCVHTIGIMELAMGMLVSGGSEILDCNFMLSSEKIMLIRCTVNVKGPIRLERLEANIDEFIKASRGLCTSSSHSLNEILPGSIGTIDKDQEMATIVSGEERHANAHDDKHYIDNLEVSISPPVPLGEIIRKDEAHLLDGDAISLRKRLVRRSSSISLDSQLERRDETKSPEFCIGDDGFFNSIVVTGIIKSNTSGVNIYRAQMRNDNGREYAVKVAQCNADSDLEILHELKQEGCVASRLNHPNICKLLDMVITPDFACLSYEYCPKGSLTTLLTESESYDFLTIAQDISNGMAYLHSMNIIHRDLKPDNIFITQDYRAKVADFGLSITDTGGQDLTGETGTYRWMAPEVIRHEKYSVASDTYSFGILLWQLVTRNPRPFDSMQPVQTAFAVAHGKRPPIPEFVPEYIGRVIRACWDTDQLCRPSFTYVSIALAKFGLAANEKDNNIDCSYHSFRNELF